MKYEFKFEKILHLKEQEKDDALAEYQDSVKKFESAAGELYKLLKKKEDLESFQASKLQSGFSIQAIRHYQQFISNLDQTIQYYQQLVMNARNRMNWYEEKLKEKNIEVKKYEKIKEKNYESFMLSEIMTESKQLDEISAVKYFHRQGN